jgi:CubicO group peptidase (beta-lactamase class C family)
VVTEGWWAPYAPDRVHLLYSLSKSFTSTAAGFAVAEGLLDLDRTVLSYFGELDADVTDERSRSILVRHVAAMASGHDTETWDRALAADVAEPVRAFLQLPPEHDPGSWFAYNQPCTYSLAAIIQRETGQTLTEFLRPRLFEPLGIDTYGWQQHPAGRDLGFTGLHATTDAIAKLGQLYLQRGWWGDRQLLPSSWVEEATRTQVANPREENPDWRQGYGFQFWMARHGYRGDGAYGQYCIVLPEQQTVVAITGASLDMQAVLDAMWTHVLPGLTDDHRVSPDRTAADLHLARRMSGLQLPATAGKPEPEQDADRWDGAVFTPVSGTCEQQPTLQSVTLRRQPDGWRLDLAEPGHTLVGRLAGDGWTVTEASPEPGAPAVPVALSGGWDSGRLVAAVQFLETPHRLLVTCDLDEQTFDVTWATVPLRSGTLAELRKPD